MMFRTTVWISFFFANSLAQCPPTPNGGCSICGEGSCVDSTAVDEVLIFPGQPEAPCGALEIAGYSGMIPLDSCSFLPSLIDVCNCGNGGAAPVVATVTPAAAPVAPTAPVGSPVALVSPTLDNLAPTGPTGSRGDRPTIVPATLSPTLESVPNAPTTIAPGTPVALITVTPTVIAPAAVGAPMLVAPVLSTVSMAPATSVPFSTGPVGLPSVLLTSMTPVSPALTTTTAPITTVPVTNAPISTAPVIVELESTMPSGSTMPSFTPTADNSVGSPVVETSGVARPANEIGMCTATLISILLAFLM